MEANPYFSEDIMETSKLVDAEQKWSFTPGEPCAVAPVVPADVEARAPQSAVT